jgi:hypothetical protein
MPVIIGGHGSGKSIIAGIFGHLTRVWACSNVDDLKRCSQNSTNT